MSGRRLQGEMWEIRLRVPIEWHRPWNGHATLRGTNAAGMIKEAMREFAEQHGFPLPTPRESASDAEDDRVA